MVQKTRNSSRAAVPRNHHRPLSLILVLDEPGRSPSGVSRLLVIRLRRRVVLGLDEPAGVLPVGRLPGDLHRLRYLPGQLLVPQPQPHQPAPLGLIGSRAIGLHRISVNVGVALVEDAEVVNEQDVTGLSRDGEGVLLCEVVQDLEGLQLRLGKPGALGGLLGGLGVKAKTTGVGRDWENVSDIMFL